MMTIPRIASVLNTFCLNSSVTGIACFPPSLLKLPGDLNFSMPTNVRLGHLAETIFSEATKASTNYRLLEQNLQVIVDKQTVGELDFVISDLSGNQIYHVEFAYKFYLFDPTIAEQVVKNWIGPNRKDSLLEKMNKLKHKQFPLFYHQNVRMRLPGISLNEVNQALCFMVSLYVPFGYQGKIPPQYEGGVKGYYLSYEAFSQMDHKNKYYCIPSKTEWGIPPENNDRWSSFAELKDQLTVCMDEQRAPLLWQKKGEEFSEFFVVWW